MAGHPTPSAACLAVDRSDWEPWSGANGYRPILPALLARRPFPLLSRVMARILDCCMRDAWDTSARSVPQLWRAACRASAAAWGQTSCAMRSLRQRSPHGGRDKRPNVGACAATRGDERAARWRGILVAMESRYRFMVFERAILAWLTSPRRARRSVTGGKLYAPHCP